jgi:predicted Zn-dependent peptidase
MTCFNDIFVWDFEHQLRTPSPQSGKIHTMIYQTRLENGLLLLLEPVETSALVSFELFIPNGVLTEPIEGSGSVMDEWLRRGAGSRNAKELENAWDDFGAIRGAEIGLEGMGFSVTSLAADAAAILELLSDWVLRPHLSTDGFAPSLELAMAALDGLEDSPDELLYTRLWEAAFSSPHRRSPYGSKSGFSSLTPEFLRTDYARRCTPQGAILACSGNLEWTHLLEMVQQHFLNWTGNTVETPEVIWNQSFTCFEPRDTAQTQIGMIMPLVAFAQTGYYESRFALEILGGGNSNRLFNEVREKRGLVYGIHAGSSFVRGTGTLEIFASCTPNHTEETINVIREELEKWHQGASLEEFTRAKIGIETGLALSLESIGARAGSCLRDAQLLGYARSIEEVQAKLQKVSLNSLNTWLQTLDFKHLRTFVLGADVRI